MNRTKNDIFLFSFEKRDMWHSLQKYLCNESAVEKQITTTNQWLDDLIFWKINCKPSEKGSFTAEKRILSTSFTFKIDFFFVHMKKFV
jgi:hypothetical protein